jgi:4-hydroxybutyrate CoA-transferase
MMLAYRLLRLVENHSEALAAVLLEKILKSPLLPRYRNVPQAMDSAPQIDLTGQVCSDSIGNQFYSGIGGQVDFLRGAARSKGSKSIIAISSVAKGGAISGIVPMLSPGAGVVTSRGLIRYVVTEYGVAYLHGETIRQRAQALIDVAHPKFREELYQFCAKTRSLQRPLAAATATR